MQANSITTVNNLTPERQRLLEVLQTGKFDSITALCEAAGVSRNVYYDAIQSQDFVAQLFQSSTGLIYASIPSIIEKIIRQAKLGSFMHQKMLLEMVKLYQGDKPDVNVAVQVNNYANSKDDLITDLKAVWATLSDEEKMEITG